MFRKFILIILFSFFYIDSRAQEPQLHRKLEDDILNVSLDKNDSLQHLLHHFGIFEGHIRTYFMNTINRGSNPDYYALATGGGLAYYSPVIKNFQVGLSGFIIRNLASSPLENHNGFTNRYELGLFDVTDPDNRDDLDRLENLYLRYYFNSKRRSFLQAGKFQVRTPLINLQDGRMRPNAQEGLWLEFKDLARVKLRGGWLRRTSPRSTVKWYGIGESVGVYPNGRAVNGEPSSYSGHVTTKNILIGNVEWQAFENLNYQYWNYYADHLLNAALQKIEVRKKSTGRTWLGGFQYLWEISLSDKGISVENQYIGPEEQAHVFSGKIGFIRNKQQREWSLNYTRITAHGRFLFPREWGIEPFYTFNNRERNEGAGDVHAVMLEHQRYLDKDRQLSIRGLAGFYEMPSVNDAKLNKYALPSYYQLGLHAQYKFRGFLYGLQARMIYTYKGRVDGEQEYPSLVIHNKAEMHHLSVMMDYFF